MVSDEPNLQGWKMVQLWAEQWVDWWGQSKVVKLDRGLVVGFAEKWDYWLVYVMVMKLA